MENEPKRRDAQQALSLVAFFRRAQSTAPEWTHALVPDFSLDGWCHVRTRMVINSEDLMHRVACSIPDDVLRPALELPIVFEELLTARVPSDIQALHLRAVGVARADELNELDREEERKRSIADAQLTLQSHHRMTARGEGNDDLAISLQVLVLEQLREIRRLLALNNPR